jgi:hypothetical protein
MDAHIHTVVGSEIERMRVFRMRGNRIDLGARQRRVTDG